MDRGGIKRKAIASTTSALGMSSSHRYRCSSYGKPPCRSQPGLGADNISPRAIGGLSDAAIDSLLSVLRLAEETGRPT